MALALWAAVNPTDRVHLLRSFAMPALSRLTLAAALLGSGALAACSDATGATGGRQVSLSFSTTPTAGAVAMRDFAAIADPLVITKAQIVFSRTELELAEGSCDSNDVENDDDGCSEIRMGPMLVDLPLTSGARTALTVTLPAGSYKKFDGRIDAVESESDGHRQDAAAFLAAHPEFRNVSIRVEGTWNGQPFVYTTKLDVDLEIEFNPAFVVDGATNNLTVQVDLAAWFRRQDGTSIDPRTANQGGANQSLVDNNIKNSVHAFSDDDRDGHDDD